MGVSLSIEVTVPSHVTANELVAIGEQCCTHEDVEGMGVGEALSWAFSDAGGVTMLSTLGVTWNAINTGRITEL